MRDELLFQDGDLGASLELQTQKMREAVEAEPEEHLKQADVDEWAAALAHHFAVAAPELKPSDVYMEPVEETTVDVSWDRSRYFSDYASDLARNFPGYRITVHVPFDGDVGVFKLRTNPFNWNPPRATVGQGELLLMIEYARDQKPDIDAKVNGFVNDVSTWLAWARAQIESFNATLEAEAKRMILARQQRVADRDAHIATSSIPVRRPGETGKAYIADVIVRRPAPSLPASRADEQPPRLEPALEARVYEHILEVIRMHGRQMEQSPGAYASLGEEDRRQQLLATLNTHYAGRAAAEAFNHQGKTDILIRFEDRNLFICECKFWTGAEGFRETIDQLFRYVGWRDSKLAIVMFVREKSLTAILGRARDALEKHEQFLHWDEAAGETQFRAVMRWPGDDERQVDLNVFFVHTPVGR